MSKKPHHILINALHTTGGGGLIYLQNILPFLAADTRFRFTLLTTTETQNKLVIPQGVSVQHAPVLRFGLIHLWEQTVIPVLARTWGCSQVWSNANYGPLLAPKASITLHTTSRAGAAWKGLKWRIYWGFLRTLTWLSLRRAPVAFAVAAHVVAEYPYSGAHKKVVVAPPAVHLNPLVIKQKESPTLIAIGDFYQQKNYPLLLQALAILREKIPTVHLTIIGRPVFESVVSEVKKIIHSKGLSKSIDIIYGLPHTKLLEHLASAHVFVNTSTAECFNMPVLEALALSVPVVCGDFDFQREVAADSAIYVPLGKGGDTASALAVALYGVLENPVIRTSLITKGRTRAAQFTWQKTADTMLEAWHKAA